MNDEHDYKYDLFISYNHNDEEWAQRLATRVEREKWRDRNLRVFFAPWEIRPGDSVDERLDRALAESRYLGLVLSPESVGSEWVGEEWYSAHHAGAKRKERRLIPLYRRACESPPFIAHLNRIDFRDEAKFEAGIRLLLAVLREEPLPRGDCDDAPQDAAPHSSVPPPPAFGFVSRRDPQGSDIVGHLVEELAPGRKRHVMLSGSGGVGKTTLAAEVARALEAAYGGRVVWSDAFRREHYTLSSLFEDITLKLDGSREHARPGDDKKEAAAPVLAEAPTLVIIDSYESAEPAERRHIEKWLREEAPCLTLFVSQARVVKLDLHNIYLLPMRREEEGEMLRLLIEEAKSKHLFTDEVCECIYDAADGNPLAMKFIVPQIDLTTRPAGVFEELMRGEGEAADRAFNRAFERHLEPDDRAALLALSLFTPSAAHTALARVAGFIPAPKTADEAAARHGTRPPDRATARGLKRLDKAVANLNQMSLLKVEDGDRLALENLTRRLAKAALDKDARAALFRRRFVEYQREHARGFKWAECQDLSDPRAERSNVVAAMKFASARKDWDAVLELFAETLNYVNTLVVWKRSVLAAENEAENRLLKKGRAAPLLIEINHRHENKRETRKHYEKIPGKLRMAGVASHDDLLCLKLPRTPLPRDEKGKLVVLSVVAFELGVCAYYRAEYQRGQGEFKDAKRLGTRARGYFKAAKKLKRKFMDYGGYAIACNNLGVTLAVEGLAGQGVKRWKARAMKEFEEARKNFEEQWKESGRYEKFEKVARLNIEWLKSLGE